MVFSSTIFLFIFLPVVLLLYYGFNLILRKHNRARIAVLNGILLVASLVFYAWGEPHNILIMIASILCNFLFGKLLGYFDAREKVRKAILIVSILFNVGMLFAFKYLNFITDIIFDLFNHGTNLFAISVGRIALPIGISFFTFQIMSYTIDVYRRKAKPQNNIFRLGLYIALFPQLIAGPIVRYVDVDNALADRSFDVEKVYKGLCRFCLGLAKKVLISNTVAQVVDKIFEMPAGNLPMATAWLGAIGYTLQIYFDFSGYSDMAIGLGHMFGFDFLENFNYPYISKSVKEFWRRWHISLSSWFRDYLYIPLGGNRRYRKPGEPDNTRNKVRTQFNIFIVWLTTGIWHGASFNFITWGLFYWVLLTAENMFLGKWFEKFETTFRKWHIQFIPIVIQHLYTVVAFVIGWVIFNSSDMSQAVHFIGSMFKFGHFGWAEMQAQLTNTTTLAFILGIVFSIPIVPWVREKIAKLKNGDVINTALGSVLSMVLLIVSVIFLTGSDYNPFIYWRF
ncbi:MAG: MBOAT family protein [Clostridia bacterium]|nr:MBOAT family protein [Clostridia bacterium]